MTRLKSISLIAVLLCGATAGLAGEGGEFLEGQADAALRYTTLEDYLGRVGEYVSEEGMERALPEYDLDLFGGRGTVLFDIMMLYRDTETHSFAVGVSPDSGLDIEMDYTAFVHNLDHDQMQNLQARERVWNEGAGAYTPGGKQVYHTDYDPLGRYAIKHTKFNSSIEGDLRFLPGNMKAFAGYSDQKQEGFKQAMTIDHCAVCHVTSNGREVNNETESWYAGFGGDIGKASMQYRFESQEFYDHTAASTHLYKDAIHPGNGTMGAEFGSRLQYDDAELIYGRSAQSAKLSHALQAKVQINQTNALRAAFTHTQRENYWNGMQSKFDAYVAAWAGRPTKKLRLNARFLAYETKVDDAVVDLSPFRGVEALDFDWTRISAANREVMQIDVTSSYKLKKGMSARLDFRRKTINRDAMAQSQTNYLFDDTGAISEAQLSAPFENETTIDRVRLSGNMRLGMKGNARVQATYKMVDQAFMNPTAMCEESLEGTNSAHVGAGPIGRLYYFQRSRAGNGTSEPSQSLRLNGRASYQLSPRVSVNAFLNYATEKNDELNNYEFERTVFSPGVNFWMAPTDRLMWTLGYSFNSVESNAALCPPFFDG